MEHFDTPIDEPRNKEFQRVNASMAQQAWNTFANLIGNVNITKKNNLEIWC